MNWCCCSVGRVLYVCNTEDLGLALGITKYALYCVEFSICSHSDYVEGPIFKEV